MFYSRTTLRLHTWRPLLVVAGLALATHSINVIAQDQPALAISPELARAYLDNAGGKLDAEDFDAARPVLQLLLRAQGVPPDILTQAAAWLADMDGDAALPAHLKEEGPPVKRRVVTIRSTAVPSVEVTEPTPAADEIPLEVNVSPPVQLPKRAVVGPDPEIVTARLEQSLDEFYERSGRYPKGYRELNELLPPGAAPLDEFDIVYYVARYGGYILTIRNRAIRESEMTIQKTGLVQ